MLNTRAKERYTKHVFSLPGLRHQFKPYRWYFKLQCSQAVLCLLIINISLQLNTPYSFSPLDFGGTKSHHLHQHGASIYTAKIHRGSEAKEAFPKKLWPPQARETCKRRCRKQEHLQIHTAGGEPRTTPRSSKSEVKPMQSCAHKCTSMNAYIPHVHIHVFLDKS